MHVPFKAQTAVMGYGTNNLYICYKIEQKVQKR